MPPLPLPFRTRGGLPFRPSKPIGKLVPLADARSEPIEPGSFGRSFPSAFVPLLVVRRDRDRPACLLCSGSSDVSTRSLLALPGALRVGFIFDRDEAFQVSRSYLAVCGRREESTTLRTAGSRRPTSAALVWRSLHMPFDTCVEKKVGWETNNRRSPKEPHVPKVRLLANLFPLPPFSSRSENDVRSPLLSSGKRIDTLTLRLPTVVPSKRKKECVLE